MTSSLTSATSSATALGPENSSPSPIQRITIKHPGYSGSNTLLALPACDGKDSSYTHYATVLAACNIFAANRSDGWLSLSRSGEPRAEPDTDGVVPAGVYFFHVVADNDNQSEPYPIVPNFRAWLFPHGCVPVRWQQAARNAAALTLLPVAGSTETCRITNKCLACETSHIVPASEKSWFADNEMDQYGELGGRTGQDVADCPSNLLRLRRDVHYLWDNLYFSIVPKQTVRSSGKVAWHAHSMSQDQEVYEDIHNLPVQPLAGRAAEYMYARFAWDIFPKLIGFLQSSQPRRLAVRQANGEVQVKLYSPQACRRFAEGQGRGRSASPTKRSRQEDADSQADDVEGRLSSRKRSRSCMNSTYFDRSDSGVSDMSQSDRSDVVEDLEPWQRAEQFSEEQETRGRKRRRSQSCLTG